METQKLNFNGYKELDCTSKGIAKLNFKKGE